MDFSIYWLKRIFYIGSLNDAAMMLLRAIFSSFAKDGIISIWSPKTYTNKAHGVDGALSVMNIYIISETVTPFQKGTNQID